MSDDLESDYKKAERELEAAINSLRKYQGIEAIPYRQRNPLQQAEPPFCSFCGKGKNEVQCLVAGPAVFICNECVTLAAEFVAANSER